MIKIGNNLYEWSSYSCQPKTKDELKDIIEERIFNGGIKCDLNDIDVSLITDMSLLFYDSKFNGDISKWDVSNVKNMSDMFTYSEFNQLIGNWNISNVTNMSSMFYESNFNQDISKWDVNNVNNMGGMFCGSKFNQDISNWKIRKDCYTINVFLFCPIKEEFKPKLNNI